MVWVRIVRFGQTVPVRESKQAFLALFSVGESRLAAAIAGPLARIRASGSPGDAHRCCSSTCKSDRNGQRGGCCTRGDGDDSSSCQTESEVLYLLAQGQDAQDAVHETGPQRPIHAQVRHQALVPGTYRVTVYCGKSGKGSARLKVGDTTPATTPVPDPIVPRRQVRNRRYRRYHHPRPRRRPAVLRRAGGRYRPTDRVAAAGFACPTPRQERTRHGSR